jgi:hypothetical protein
VYSCSDSEVIECEIKEKTGTAKVLDITSDKFLQPVLKKLGDYLRIFSRPCKYWF